MNTQMLALWRTTASTWGATMPKARHIYQAVIRSALSYGAALWHQHTSNASKPKGLTAKLQKQQNKGLRTVLGTFKATPIRQLETESYVPLLDLWLNGRIARFQARMEHSGIAQKVKDACATSMLKAVLRLVGIKQYLAVDDLMRTVVGTSSMIPCNYDVTHLNIERASPTCQWS